jgi:hypothetical protein
MGQCQAGGTIQYFPSSSQRRYESQWRHWRFTLKPLNLSYSDFEKFFCVYCMLDPELKGYVRVEDVVKYLDIHSEKYMTKMLSQFDDDVKGRLDFVQFVLCIWSYCTEHHSSLVAYSITTLLKGGDESAKVETAAARGLLMDIFLSMGRTKKSIQEYERNLDYLFAPYPNVLAKGDTMSLVLFNPVLSLASTALQKHVRDVFLGENVWAAIMALPICMPDDRRVSLNDFKQKVC